MAKMNVPAKTDEIVSRFTKDLLRLANEQGVNFDYVGPKRSRTDEVLKVLKEDVKVVDLLMQK